MKMPTAMGGHKFSEVPRADIQRSAFHRNKAYKTTGDAGWLLPMLVEEVLPGDTFKVATRGFGRLNTPIVPIMDNLYLDTFYFFVPDRLIWTNFQRFMGEQDDPGDPTDFTEPVMTVPTGGYLTHSMADYFGIPVGVDSFEHRSAPFRCYALIWNQWFRDQNLQASAHLDLDDGPDDPANYPLQRRGKRHDYFTSCLPYPQKISQPVPFPLQGFAPIIGIGKANNLDWDLASQPARETDKTADTTFPFASRIDFSDTQGQFVVRGSAASNGLPMIYADLERTFLGMDINTVRTAFQVQRFLEKDMRGGTRYTEIVRGHFDVTSPDARLQRPEYLGGGSAPIMVSPIAQNSSTDATTPQGNLAGIGTVSWGQHGFFKSFTEHGWIIGLMCVRADLTYQQGLERFWSRQTRVERFWPTFAHLGEQAVLKKEIWLSGVPAVDDSVFGYQERYAEYRYGQSLITGMFRSTTNPGGDELDIWHLSQILDDPSLNGSFIAENPPIDRITAVEDQPHFKFDLFHQIASTRPMPLYGVPGMMDHF